MAGPTVNVPNLQSNGHRDLLNIIDKLREIGVNHYVDLPQIVVCGDQSSGKSSVLEAISGQSFPTETGLCTRFPTELSLRRDDKHKITVSILAANSRSEDEKARLAKFSYADSNDGSAFDLTEVVQKAMKELGLENDLNNESANKSIVRDVLRVEISGPHLSHLTLVDLPGLFTTASKTQSKQDIGTVNEIAAEYTSNERTVILAVVPAAYDYHVQQGTSCAMIADPEKLRTLPLITKPDLVEGGPKGAQKWINLVANKDEQYKLGWHVLRNPSFEERRPGLNSRDDLEKEFFRRGPWAALDPDRRGVEPLRMRLSEVLKDQIIAGLPDVLKEVENKISVAKYELFKLGTCRETIDDQRLYLENIQADYSQIIVEAIAGPYHHAFFDGNDNGTHRKLFAHVRDCQEEFEKKMNTHGHALNIIETPQKNQRNMPKNITREEYAGIALDELLRHRARELPGSYNPATIATLFRRQIMPWQGIIESYIDKVIDRSYNIVDIAFTYITDETTAKAIIRHLNARKDNLRKLIKEEMRKILTNNTKGHLHPTIPGLSEKIVQAQRNAEIQTLREALRPFISSDGNHIEATLAEILETVSHVKTASDMDKYASLQATYVTQAYYDLMKVQTIQGISTTVINSVFLNKLEELFDRGFVRKLDDKTVNELAGESPTSAEHRKQLNKKIEVLEEGLRELRHFHQPTTQAPPVVQVDPPQETSLDDSFANLNVDSENPGSQPQAHHARKSSRGSTNGTPRRRKPVSAPQAAEVETESDEEVQPKTPHAASRSSPDVAASPEPGNAFGGRREPSPSQSRRSRTTRKSDFNTKVLRPLVPDVSHNFHVDRDEY